MRPYGSPFFFQGYRLWKVGAFLVLRKRCCLHGGNKHADYVLITHIACHELTDTVSNIFWEGYKLIKFAGEQQWMNIGREA